MQVHAVVSRKRYRVRVEEPLDISIPLDFHGDQPNAFFLPRARATRVAIPSCRCEMLELTPHGNGTHTECVGHLTRSLVPVPRVLNALLIPATLVSVKPEARENGHRVISSRILEQALKNSARAFLSALVIRTLPNGAGKRRARYSGTFPSYFEPQAIRALNRLGVNHLLVDLPSLDREDDRDLTAHRLFWGLSRKRNNPKKKSVKTVTEMVYVADAIPDGSYFLAIQIPPFVQDAAPSRPILFRAEKA